MKQSSFDRRRVLGLGIGLGIGAAAGSARAFQLQEMGPGTERVYRAACEAPALHAQLLAEVDAQLAGRHLSAEEVQAIKASTRCPFCGCALVPASPPLGSDAASAPF